MDELDHEREIQEQESGDPGFIDRAAAGLPFARLLQPDEVAKAVLWMASEDSGMMTGSVIQFDQSVWGGYDGQAPGTRQTVADAVGRKLLMVIPIASEGPAIVSGPALSTVSQVSPWIKVQPGTAIYGAGDFRRFP
ncbi:MAG: SDR family oxidoreductase [Thiolinea sp.]